jgi:hypothetical protein
MDSQRTFFITIGYVATLADLSGRISGAAFD